VVDTPCVSNTAHNTRTGNRTMSNIVAIAIEFVTVPSTARTVAILAIVAALPVCFLSSIHTALVAK
jgi:hypothetical protein